MGVWTKEMNPKTVKKIPLTIAEIDLILRTFSKCIPEPSDQQAIVNLMDKLGFLKALDET